MTRSRRIVREAGTAFAVLAIYVLTLLLPLHQAAGLQRDLSRLGFETIGSWSICAELSAQRDGDPEPAAIKCPAAGIGKYQFAAVMPPAIQLDLPIAPVPFCREHAVFVAATSPPDHFGQSRAPPPAFV